MLTIGKLNTFLPNGLPSLKMVTWGFLNIALISKCNYFDNCYWENPGVHFVHPGLSSVRLPTRFFKQYTGNV